MKKNTFIDDSFDSTADWEGRHTAGYVVYDGKMWIIGGDVNQGHYHYDVWNSTDGVKWNYVNKGKDVPWGPRALHYTLVFNGKIWVMGGQTIPQFAQGTDTIFYDDIWNTSDGLNWTRVIPKEPHWCSRGMIGGSVVFNNKMWVLGGELMIRPHFRKGTSTMMFGVPRMVFLGNRMFSSHPGSRDNTMRSRCLTIGCEYTNARSGLLGFWKVGIR